MLNIESSFYNHIISSSHFKFEWLKLRSPIIMYIYTILAIKPSNWVTPDYNYNAN